MSKYCLSCMSKIPLLASRCPNCIDRDQSVWGRIILVIMLIAGMFIGAKYYLHYHKKGDAQHKELIEKLNKLGV